jgi:hypothetical protein
MWSLGAAIVGLVVWWAIAFLGLGDRCEVISIPLQNQDKQFIIKLASNLMSVPQWSI